MNIKFNRSLSQKLSDKIEGYQFEVGVLDDGPHRNPKEQGLFQEPETTTYVGGPVRKKTRVNGVLTIGQILIDNMKRLGIDILRRPFQEQSSDIIKFTHEFLKLALSGKVVHRRVENLLQAVVRNPILKQEYGRNKAHTADAKGFDRHLFDTGQMFQAIKARAKRVRK